MKEQEQVKKVKMNLTLEKAFFDLLKQQANRDYLKVTTYSKRLLMKYLSYNNETLKNESENENTV